MKIGTIKTLHEGWGRYLLVTVDKPDGGRLAREVEDHGDAAGVLPYDPERRTALLVRQLRVPLLLAAGVAETLEVAAGCIDDEESPEACIRREAMEELGIELAAVEKIVTAHTMPGISTERIHLFLAPYSPAERTDTGGGLAAEEEEITVVEMPLADLAAMADDGRIEDAKTLILLQTLRLRRPDLFSS